MIEHGDVGGDDRIRAAGDGGIGCLTPRLGILGARERVDGDQNLAAMIMRKANTVRHLLRGKVEFWKIASIRLVAKAAIHGIGAGLHGRTQRCRCPSWAHEFHAAARAHTRSL